MKKHQKEFLAIHGTPDHVNLSFNDPKEHIREKSAMSPFLSPENVKRAVEHSSWRTRYKVAGNPNLSQDQIKQLSLDPVWDVRHRLSLRKDIPSETIETFLNDEHPYVKAMFVSKRDDLTKEQIDRVLEDSSKMVQSFVADSPSYKNFYPNGRK